MILNIKNGNDLDGEVVPARFTFVITKNVDGKYEIINHHSSIFA